MTCSPKPRLVQRPRHNTLESTVYQVDWNGTSYRLAKEFYADGPSLFTWTVGAPGMEQAVEFGTRREALAWIAARTG